MRPAALYTAAAAETSRGLSLVSAYGAATRVTHQRIAAMVRSAGSSRDTERIVRATLSRGTLAAHALSVGRLQGLGCVRQLGGISLPGTRAELRVRVDFHDDATETSIRSPVRRRVPERVLIGQLVRNVRVDTLQLLDRLRKI